MRDRSAERAKNESGIAVASVRGNLCALFVAALFLSGGPTTADAAVNAAPVETVTVQRLNHNLGRYMGKQVALIARIEQVLGNGGYLVEDESFAKNEARLHRILIYIPVLSSDHADRAKPRQQAGQLASELKSAFKSGDLVRLQGKVERFATNNEVDAFSPKRGQDDFAETKMSVPVVVVRPEGIEPEK